MDTQRAFEALATVNQIPPEGVLAVVKSDGRRVCLIRSRGLVTAVADNCTHQDFEMSLGDVLPDGTIQCAWHGARFDCSTGAVRQGPACDPLPMFEVKLDGDDILVGALVGQSGSSHASGVGSFARDES
jgi:3-phenylpropionate/trans-cinnamate dioxygenase ferredoxin subunit